VGAVVVAAGGHLHLRYDVGDDFKCRDQLYVTAAVSALSHRRQCTEVLDEHTPLTT
jgi:hypothetical protein